MTDAAFSTELDRLAELNGLPRSALDTVIFNARASWFKRTGTLAVNHKLIAQLKLALASEATRREIVGA